SAGAVFAALIGRPGWIALLACDGGEPIAAGLAFIRAGTGYLAAAATAPAHRCRGAQGALVRARLARLFDLGCDLVVSETGESVPGDPQHSQHNLERFGLAPVYVRENYAPPAVAGRAPWHHRGRDDAEAPSLRRSSTRAGGAA